MKATLIDVMGNDLKIVNAARASFGKRKEEFTPADKRLIQFLARGLTVEETEELLVELSYKSDSDKKEILELLNKYRGTSEHWTPFAHCYVTFQVEMPIFVARQLIRHTVGVTISEMSRRYVDEDPKYYYPEGWRVKAPNVKQGSSDQVLQGEAHKDIQMAVEYLCQSATKMYRTLVDDFNVAPELARMVLPQNTYTEWTWTISLVTAIRVCRQRLDPHAQKEIRDLAIQIDGEMEKAFPVAWKALKHYGTEDIL